MTDSRNAAPPGLPQPGSGQSPPGPGTPTLRALLAHANGCAILALAGDLDMTTTGTLTAAVRDCLRECPAGLSLDLRSVNFCDVAGVRALRRAQREAAAVHAEFRLIAPGPLLVRMFTLLDADDFLFVTDQ